MKLYADRPTRVLSQLIGDLVVVIMGYLAIRLGLATHARVAELAGPGRDAEATARQLDGQLRDAAGNLRDTPLVGGTLAKPFRALAATSRDLAAQAQAYQDSVERLATLAGFLVAGVILVVLLVLWLPRRVSWIVEASAASRLVRRSEAAADLLAVRALARQPLRVLARVDPDVVAGWRAGDPAAAGVLAALELDELGLRLPRDVRLRSEPVTAR
jgi:acyl-CoA synthetase (AMP-forming)/AMP-acid ligase II